MKKILFFILFPLILTLISACENSSVDITEEKEFNVGDTIEYKGVIYEYFDTIKVSNFEDSKEYIFKEEKDYKAYYDYYYYDMSDYQNQLPIKSIDVWDYYEKKAFDSDIELSPTSAYFTRLYPLFNASSYKSLDRGFIVKGYKNKNLPKDVVIPQQLFGHKVRQIGYRAFDGAVMESVTWECYEGLIHPYAFHNCFNLKKLDFKEIIVLSMGISNCSKLEMIIGDISPLGDCVLYNLPEIRKIDAISFNLYKQFDFAFKYGLGGIRKSFFYLCPKLKEIESDYFYKKANVYYNLDDVPILLLDNYTLTLNETGFTTETRKRFTVLYNQDSLEAYIPFLNDGLNKKGTIKIPQNSQVFVEEVDGIYAYVTYLNEDFNAKVLIQKK